MKNCIWVTPLQWVFNDGKWYFSIFCLCLSVCPAPPSLNIISCKYENRQRLQCTTEFAGQYEKKDCTILVSLCRHCQSKAQQNMGAQYVLFPKRQVDLWPSDRENGVRVMCDLGYFSENVGLPRPLCSRVILGSRDRQTSKYVRRIRREPPKLDKTGAPPSLQLGCAWHHRYVPLDTCVNSAARWNSSGYIK